jgi:hypothetical protein
VKPLTTQRIAGAVTAALVISVWLIATSNNHTDEITPVAGASTPPPEVLNTHNHASLLTDSDTAAPLEILGNNCDNSDLEPHDGFQNAPRCVSTAFGEVPAQANGAQLLIVDAPKNVRVGEPFNLKISTRNLIRDRFLAAGQGGYYLESSFLDEQGLVRGHFHTACRLIADDSVAPQPDRNAIFVATEDEKGGKEPDVVTVRIANGLPTKGTFQCAAWAGDGSHRIPMMQFANQIPAFDTVDIEAVGGGKGG